MTVPVTPPVTPAAADDHKALEALFGRFHVLLVHFPIALLLAAALAELLAALFVSASMSAAARFCAYISAIMAPVTAWAGLERAESYTPLPGLEQTMDWHRYGGIATAALALLIGLIGWFAGRQNASPGVVRAFRWMLFAVAVLVALTAHFGGQLVHGAGYPFE